MQEDAFVQEALEAAREIVAPPLSIQRGASLLYEVRVTNRLEIAVDPRRPTRGQSAFQTDLCVFEEKAPGIEIPRVVLEFKPRLTTHDVLTYSAKARKHKLIYPYLRYGLVISRFTTIPNGFYTHNEALDFCVAAASYTGERIHEIFARVLREEIDASRRLEAISSGEVSAYLFRTLVAYERWDWRDRRSAATARGTKEGTDAGSPRCATPGHADGTCVGDRRFDQPEGAAPRPTLRGARYVRGRGRQNAATGATQYARWRKFHGGG